MLTSVVIYWNKKALDNKGFAIIQKIPDLIKYSEKKSASSLAKGDEPSSEMLVFRPLTPASLVF